MSEASVGDPAPDFNLPATDGSEMRLSDLRGRRVVLYFYPKDNTPGCTREGQSFRDLYPEFERRNALILGVSRDSVKSHEGFKATHELPFALLSDRDERACELFGVMKDKRANGRTSRGVERSTFLIDEDGILRREWRKVDVDGHADAVLEAIDAL